MNFDLFNSEINDVKASLDENLVDGYANFLKFVDTQTSDSELRFRAMFLGSQLTDYLNHRAGIFLSDKEATLLLTEAYSILEKLIQEVEGSADIMTKANTNINVITKINHLRRIIFKAENIAGTVGIFSIKPISFSLRLGEITSIVGKNGNGKSTLLRMIAGELAISSGQISYPDICSGPLDWKEIKASIAYIPQETTDVTSNMSIKDHLHFVAATKGIIGRENELAVKYIIARLGLNNFQFYSRSSLSGGYKLRFELARQLVWSPKLLIMDEPLANLDIKAQALLLNDLRNLTNSLKTPLSIVLSSQNLYDIEDISDNIIFLDDGIPKYIGAVKDINNVSNNFCYLLTADCKLSVLRQALVEHAGSILEIREELSEKIILTTKSISGNVLLTALIAANISISNFRDISNSTRMLFENEKDKQYDC
jgi:ABC-2 type transport system ATP-binding protein